MHPLFRPTRTENVCVSRPARAAGHADMYILLQLRGTTTGLDSSPPRGELPERSRLSRNLVGAEIQLGGPDPPLGCSHDRSLPRLRPERKPPWPPGAVRSQTAHAPSAEASSHAGPRGRPVLNFGGDQTKQGKEDNRLPRRKARLWIPGEWCPEKAECGEKVRRAEGRAAAVEGWKDREQSQALLPGGRCFCSWRLCGLARSLRGCLSALFSEADWAARGRAGGVDRLTMLNPVTHGCVVFFGVSQIIQLLNKIINM